MNLVELNWTIFKALVVVKKLMINYRETANGYYIFADEGTSSYVCGLFRDGNGDTTDFENNYKSGANKLTGTKILGHDGNYVAAVDNENRLKVKTVVAVGEVTGVGEIYGWDLYHSGWVNLGGTITTDDWVKITINGYDSQYIVQGGDTLADVAIGLTAAINANNDVKNIVDAYNFCDRVYINAEEYACEGEGITLVTSISSGATITATVNTETSDNDDKMQQMWKKVLIEQDPNDRTKGWLGIFGDVGSRTKAENPIHIVVRKNLATKDEVVFADKDVPVARIWYITNVAVADELRSEIRLYHGIIRDHVDTFSGDGAEDTFTLDYNTVGNANYLLVTVGGTPKVLGTDYDIVQNPDNSEKHDIVFGALDIPPSGTDNIVITYDAVLLKLDVFVQTDTTQEFTYGAPIKLVTGEFLVATVEHGSANAGVAAVNVVGFYEVVK